MGMWECSENIRPAHTLDLNSVSALHEHDENTERVDSSAKAVSKFHTHSIPLDMEDIERDWDKPVTEAGIAAKASVIVRVGMLDLGAGTGSFRVREMMHRIAYPLGVHVRADVNLTDIEASCTDGKDRITEVVDLPTTGVNTERIWLLEHFADWFNVNLGKGSMYHSQSDVSEGLMQHLDKRDASQVSAELSKQLKERQKAEQNQEGSDDPVLDALEMVTERAREGDSTARPLHMRDIEAAAAAGRSNGDSVAEKPRKNRNCKPPKEYAEHFDHIGKAAGESQGVTVRQAHERLDMIERRKPLYSPAFAGLASACACASFVFLLGGGPYDMIGAFVGAGLGHWLRRRLFAHHLNQFFVTFVCVAVAALACTGMLRLIGLFDPIALQHDTGIDYGMTVHRQPFTGSDRNPKNRNTGRSRRIRRQCRAVPTLGSIDDRRGTGPCLAGVRRHNSARFSDRIAAQLPQRITGHYFRFFLRITSSISSVMLDRSHSGFQPHSSRAQVSSSELGQLSAMAFFTGSTS